MSRKYLLEVMNIGPKPLSIVYDAGPNNRTLLNVFYSLQNMMLDCLLRDGEVDEELIYSIQFTVEHRDEIGGRLLLKIVPSLLWPRSWADLCVVVTKIDYDYDDFVETTPRNIRSVVNFR